MNIDFINIGPIQKANINLSKKLTIFCGENNTGKTYINYSIYSLLKTAFNLVPDFMASHVDEIKEQGIYQIDMRHFFDQRFESLIKKIEKNYLDMLPFTFATNQDFFKDSQIQLHFNKELLSEYSYKKEYNDSLVVGKNKKVLEIEKQTDSPIVMVTLLEKGVPDRLLAEKLSETILKIIFGDVFGKTFLLPAERTGINLFFKELNVNRNVFIDNLNKLEKKRSRQIDLFEFMDDIISRYPLPISDFIYFLNDLEYLKRQKSEYKSLATELQRKIVKGSYRIEDKDVYFQPYRSGKKKLNLHIASSTAKTFFSLVFYLEHMAEKGDYLIIDEPELNLHPDNQRNIARIIARLINKDIRVIISTHSDYILRELNNLILLNEKFKGRSKLMKKYKYSEEELMSTDSIAPYLFGDHAVHPMEMSREEGIIAKTFDSVINSMNESADDIYYKKREHVDNA
ncbi:ABC transporter [Desulfonema ishimotonii]|uniref:ABC transporter n=1 Tax=Desulfonema ishimotonii TaxID=45657 RepID=A0A401G1R2_9BACT|nr:ABC transporter [Desulfonema ishimotonii]